MVHKLGRRANNGESSSIAIPPPLPPSVEEAYRRKCVQLKRRTNEVEEDNEAARLRLLRLRRGVEKLRLERAFLLDQLAKRTSTNVEDSDGSPSPPPTPQDKPLRSKRGHRKPSVVAALESGTNGPPPTFINQNVHNLSPSSDAFSHSATAGEAGSGSQQTKEPLAQRSNGVSDSGGSSKTAKKQSASAFELYCAEHRAAAEDSKEEDVTVEEELARGWKELPQSQKDEYTAKEKEAAVDKDKDNEKDKDKDKDKDKEEEKTKEARSAAAESPAEDTPAQDDDVEMENED